MDDIDLLQSVLAKDEALIAAVGSDQLRGPTPCPDYDVGTLVNHIVGWAQAFEAGANGREHEGDPATYTSADPVADFREAAAGVVAGWRAGGVDRKVGITGGKLPGQMVLAMTIMEFVAHGWDLATATGQQVPFSDDELAAALARAETTLPPEYRGAGKPFGDQVEVPADAPVLDRFVAFMGRRP
jgi:uncharacterized protein (TIGR03086 family)